MSSGPDPSPTGGEFKAVPPGTIFPKRPIAGRLTAEDLIILNEEIATMARAGLPLYQGMQLLAREMGLGRLQTVTRQLGEDLKAGFTLPQALERQGGRVPPYYAALLAAAIRSGKTGEVLGTLTLYARSIVGFRVMLASAFLYPAVILILGSLLLACVGLFIIPKFIEVYDSFKMKLPLVTQILFFFGSHTLEFLVAALIFLAELAAVRLLLRTSARGRILWTRFTNGLPVLGMLIRYARLAAFADLLGILVNQAIPLPEALRLSAEASSDPLLAEGARRIEKDVSQGMTLGEALHKQLLVPDLIVWMVRFGERQGTLGSSLNQLAQMYRRKAEARAALLRTILPPLLIVLLAMTLGSLFIFGLMAPMFELLDGLSGGGKR